MVCPCILSAPKSSCRQSNWRASKRLAAREKKSVGAVIRDAVDAFVGAEPDKRRQALETLFAMELPVDDWEVMKAEIERSRYPDLYPEP